MGELYCAVDCLNYPDRDGKPVYFPNLDLALKVKNGYVVIGNIISKYNFYTNNSAGCKYIPTPHSGQSLKFDYCGHIIIIQYSNTSPYCSVNVDGKYLGVSPLFFKL